MLVTKNFKTLKISKKYLFTFFVWLGCLSISQAHESRPLYLKITKLDSLLLFEVNVPNTVHAQNLPSIKLNEHLVNDGISWKENTSGYRQKWQMPDAQFSLKGSQISVEYPIFNPVVSAIIALKLAKEEEQILIIPPNESMVVIPQAVDAFTVRKQYTILGIEHIWAGIDHLLFLVCLLIITGFSQKLLITITGFTIAHSITLILSALKIIQLPIPPIEACIALSIVFLCYEIIHHHHQKDSLTYRKPILVASSFGLLHGLGFAAVLGEIGLPQKFSTEALLFFNVGVEIGQLLFIAALLVLISIFNKISQFLFTTSKQTLIFQTGLKFAIYAVGIIAAYWMFDRIL